MKIPMWIQAWQQYKGRIIGLASGLFLGFIYLFSGFWDMLIVGFIVFVCYLLGKKSDDQERWPSPAEWWQWLMDRWRMLR